MDPIKENNYWEGPYGIRVDLDVPNIVAQDGTNIHSSDGTITMNVIEFPLTRAQYFANYTELRPDGYSWWKRSDCWVGPYGIMVDWCIGYVRAADGNNLHFRNGRTTAAWASGSTMTKGEYLDRYGEYRDDGNIWWSTGK